MIKNAGFECGTEYLNFDEQPATMLDANLLSVEEGYPVNHYRTITNCRWRTGRLLFR